MLKHLGALIFAALGTIGVFALSLGMNAQVVKKEDAVATIIQTVVEAPPPKTERRARGRSTAPKKARRAASNPGPALAAGLAGLDFGLADTEQGAFSAVTDALLGTETSEVRDESEVEEPPVATERSPPRFPARARSLDQSGKVTVAFVVDIDGSVQDATVVLSEPAGVFDEAALEAVRSWRFSPGREAGQPVAVRVRQTLRFELE